MYKQYANKINFNIKRLLINSEITQIIRKFTFNLFNKYLIYNISIIGNLKYC